jgi:hypothetical protein
MSLPIDIERTEYREWVQFSGEFLVKVKPLTLSKIDIKLWTGNNLDKIAESNIKEVVTKEVYKQVLASMLTEAEKIKVLDNMLIYDGGMRIFQTPSINEDTILVIVHPKKYCELLIKNTNVMDAQRESILRYLNKEYDANKY